MSFTPPPVTIGQIVHWRCDPSSPPSPAIITKVGSANVVALSIIEPGYANLHPLDGVRHISDPAWEKSGNRAAGVWEHTPYDLQIRSVLTDLVPQEA